MAGRGPLLGGVSGLLGPQAEMVSRVRFFSFFLFQTLFKSTFWIQIQIKPFQPFHKIFINILEVTQATKNHAKPNNDAQSLVVSRFIKLSLIF
jgi:hypothetical protein